MRHRHRGIVAVLGVTALLLAATAGARSWLLYLPPPERCDAEELGKWLVLRDLTVESPAVRAALLERLEATLRDQPDFASTSTEPELSDRYRQRLADNIRLLKHQWFTDRVADYHACPAAERMDFLQRQLEVVLIWSNIDVPVGDAAAATSADGMQTDTDTDSIRHGYTMEFFGDIERWMAEANETDRAAMLTAVRDGMICWLATRPLTDEPPATRLDLAQRIIADLNSGLRLGDLFAPLTPTQRDQLLANGRLLLEAWFHAEAKFFASLPADQRTSHLDRRIDEFSAWGIGEFFAATDAGVSKKQPSAADLIAFFAMIDGWIEAAAPATQPNLRRLADRMQQRIVWRQMQSMLQARPAVSTKP